VEWSGVELKWREGREEREEKKRKKKKKLSGKGNLRVRGGVESESEVWDKSRREKGKGKKFSGFFYALLTD
jgi:hypothetical protein